jgi:hypothetical protein
VNCYAEPVFTLDATIVVMNDTFLAGVAPQSDLRFHITTDQRYQSFPSRATDRDVLGIRARVACLEDVVEGKLWAWSDPSNRLSKRKKDELDLIRLAEAYPELLTRYPPELRRQLTGE